MLLLLCCSLILAVDQPHDGLWRDESLGIAIRLPDASWRLSDHSQGIAKAYVFAPGKDLRTRATVMVLPTAVLPQGMETRETQVRAVVGKGYRRVALEADKLGGEPAQRLDYEAAGTISREYGLRRGDFYVIFQTTAPTKSWDDAQLRAAMTGIRDSFEFTGPVQTALPAADRSTPEAIRAKRALQKLPPREFEVMHHDVRVEIEPAAHSLRAVDHLRVRSMRDTLDQLELITSLVNVENVEGPAGLKWEMKAVDGANRIVIHLAQPCAKDAELDLTVTTTAADYLQKTDSKLIQEIETLGQVREKSSWSSHIAYYPIDRMNDATVDMTLVVPEGYTAVTGGRADEVTIEQGRATFRYHNEVRRPRLLPFGFAVARYIQASGTSKGGLPLQVFGYPGEEKLLEQRLAIAIQCANLLEGALGPLPFEAVRIAHVTPVAKEMGVSLPGLILVSDGYFHELKDQEIDQALSEGRPEGREALGAVIIADELSHQWNCYAVAFPNELAEGISTFTNALWIEQRCGAAAYRKMIRYCVNGYFTATTQGPDVAIADSAIYATGAYRGIAFCKVAVVLDMLRTELGDEAFFAAWREAFQPQTKYSDGFGVMERAFLQSTGKDLAPFFRQWFYQAGCPVIALDFSQQDQALTVNLRQKQPQEPYRLRGDLLIQGKQDESLRKEVTLDQRETRVTFDVPFVVAKVMLDPDDKLLIKRSDDKPGAGSTGDPAHSSSGK